VQDEQERLQEERLQEERFEKERLQEVRQQGGRLLPTGSLLVNLDNLGGAAAGLLLFAIWKVFRISLFPPCHRVFVSRQAGPPDGRLHALES
jgi:hypothetical protein